MACILARQRKLERPFITATFQFGRKVFLEERDVLLVELLLKGFRGGGNHHAAAAADCGQQIGQRFAGARARFKNGVVMIFEGVVDGLGHLQLGGAVLVAADHGSIEEAAGPKISRMVGLVASGALRRR